MRTTLIVIAVGLVLCGVTVAIFVLRTCREAQALVPAGYRPSASAYSYAFTDALWMQVEHTRSVVVDRDVTVATLLMAAVSKGSRSRSGFLLATVAARSRELARERVDSPLQAVVVLREIASAEALMKRYDPDTLAAMYAETAPFGGTIVGLDAAARALLGKPAALLSAAEAAFLVTLSWSTNRCDMARLRERSKALLMRMRAAGLAEETPRLDEVSLPALQATALCYVTTRVNE